MLKEYLLWFFKNYAKKLTAIIGLLSCIYFFLAVVLHNPLANSIFTHNPELKHVLGFNAASTAEFLTQTFGIMIFTLLLLALSHFFCVLNLAPKVHWVRYVSAYSGLIMLFLSLSFFEKQDNFPLTGLLGFLIHDQWLKILNLFFTHHWWPEVNLALLTTGVFCFTYGFGIGYSQVLKIFSFVGRSKRRADDFWKKHQGQILKPILAEETKRSELLANEEDASLEFAEKTKAKKKLHQTSIIGFDKSQEGYLLPSLDLIEKQHIKAVIIPEKELQAQAEKLVQVLSEFGVQGEITSIQSGPVVTTFELKPAPGIKTSRVVGLADDIARSMSAISVRIATVPGQNVIGIEMPNEKRQTVFLRDLLSQSAYLQSGASLPIILGKNIIGKAVVADLAKMPHLLVAGTTGSGKSVGVNAMILSLLYALPPEQCRFIMIDPKMLELSVYNDIPHLLTPVVTEPKKAIVALKWAVKEMENRYRKISQLGVRNIQGYNKRLKDTLDKGEKLTRRVQTGFDSETGQATFEDQQLDMTPLPLIVVVIDEMADLMLVAGKEVEAAVQRLAQMARAAGIHLIMATQRPSVDVITGTIKANFPTRISFQVTSRIDSRTILGEQGAEQLLGQGDMLFMTGGGRIKRVHGAFTKDNDVEAVVKYIKTQGKPDYIEDVTVDTEELDSLSSSDDSNGDAIYAKAVSMIREEGKVSTSFIQRRFSIGYNRAARIVDLMEEKGVVSPPNHQGKREIL